MIWSEGVCFVDISGIVHHHCLSFLSIMDTAEIFSGNAKLQSINQLDIKIDVISWIVYASGVFVYFISIINIGENKHIIITYSLHRGQYFPKYTESFNWFLHFIKIIIKSNYTLSLMKFTKRFIATCIRLLTSLVTCKHLLFWHEVYHI